MAALGLAIACDLARRGLARDVIPDLADPQIALVADWMGHPAPEVAAAVTKPLTEALADVPGAKAIRGSTMTGMAYVDVVFASASGLDAAHREIAARVEAARAPGCRRTSASISARRRRPPAGCSSTR